MALNPAFPTDPHAILDPEMRWFPGESELAERGYGKLLPPLVYKVRQGVKTWRDGGYAGACPTTRALLNWWFNREHLLLNPDNTERPFRYYFAQREAVESAIWLYEVKKARDPISLIEFDSSEAISPGMFAGDWTRYVMKMATGTGKTKVMSLLIAWAYFHKRYESDSDLSTNFLLIAPNIIVLDRLRTDFDSLRIFHHDPVLPENGYEGRNWKDDFQMSLHVQDQIGAMGDTGNIFLSNIHRVFDHEHVASFEDADTTDYFLGPRPPGRTGESRLDLGAVIRGVPDLVVLNDEAHHIHDERLAWFQSIRDISDRLRLKGSRLAAQFDLTATPKHDDGAIFVQTISDYPLVEAIRQGVVKHPVLPDAASRAKLREQRSAKYSEQYRDYLHLGYLEWKKVYDELAPAGKKSVLFVMTDDTRNCDEVAEWLEGTYPELSGAVLVIHTKNNGEISEASGSKSQEELEKLRKLSRTIDDPDNPYKAIVSVMVLREGWDVQNVVSIVGLRPYQAKSRILPEQTLGRGLRPMFRGRNVQERVSVIGTEAFIDFVESIKAEGVELEHVRMDQHTRAKSPIVVEVDRANPKKNIEELDIDLPVLAPRIRREYKNLEALTPAKLPHEKIPLRMFTPEQQREITFKHIDTDGISHITVMDGALEPTYRNVVGFFAKEIMRDLRLVGGFDVLFGKLKTFVERELFETPVRLEDSNVLRNLSEPAAVETIRQAFKKAINELTVQDTGTTRVVDHIKISATRPAVVDEQPYLIPRQSIFNKVLGNHFELKFAKFLDDCQDIISFVRGSQQIRYKIEYQGADGSIANYYPDFVVKKTPDSFWIIETKGREDLDDPKKFERLRQWCADASQMDAPRKYQAIFVREETWNVLRPRTFQQLVDALGGK